MDTFYTQLKSYGKVKLKELLSKHLTFKVGGPAKYFVIVNDQKKLVELLQFLEGEGINYLILGAGSNLLAHDEGYDGVIIKVKSQKLKVKSHPDLVVIKLKNYEEMEVDAGCSMTEVAQKSFQAGLIGFEWAVGVPGTIGGSVRGNAGANGGEMKDSVFKVEVYRDGEIVELNNADCQFGYRDSLFKHNQDVILRVWLKLKKGNGKEAMKKALENLQYRNKTQPQGYASSGCIFRNVECSKIKKELLKQFPKEFVDKKIIPAGWMIEECGLKGEQIGGAQVNEKHGNFIVNLGNAKAEDVFLLIEKVKEKVYNKFKVELEEEVKII